MDKLYDIMLFVLKNLIILVCLKSMLIGSDFNFFHWFKYRKKYTKWYFNRKKFQPHVKLEEE